MAKYPLTGSTFKIGAAAGAPSTAIGQVISGEVDFGSLNKVDSTTTSDAVDTFEAGTRSPLSFSVVVQWDPAAVAAHATVITDFKAGTLVSAGAFFRDGAAAGTKPSVYSDGRWINATAPIAVNGRMQATYQFDGSGDFTFASGGA